MNKCCFAGHNEVYGDSIRKSLFVTIENIILNDDIRVFWVGNYGAFDRMVACILNELKKVHSIRIELIIPYLTREIMENREFYNRFFDSVIVADIPSTTHFKSKIVKTNEYMVDNSEYLICFVNKEWGGAVNTLKYAEKKKKHIINIAEL